MKGLHRISVFATTTVLMMLPQLAMAASWHDRLVRWFSWLPEWFIIFLHKLIGVL